LTEPQNYVWCVNNKITGITVAIYYNRKGALIRSAQCVDLEVKRMEIDYE
jgi:hypothetical protein